MRQFSAMTATATEAPKTSAPLMHQPGMSIPAGFPATIATTCLKASGKTHARHATLAAAAIRFPIVMARNFYLQI